jgi:hypothetical protein
VKCHCARGDADKHGCLGHCLAESGPRKALALALAEDLALPPCLVRGDSPTQMRMEIEPEQLHDVIRRRKQEVRLHQGIIGRDRKGRHAAEPCPDRHRYSGLDPESRCFLKEAGLLTVSWTG